MTSVTCDCCSTVVDSLSLLLAGSGSVVDDEVDAVLLIGPVSPGSMSTAISTLAVSPGASVPTGHVTVPPASAQMPVDAASLYTTPLGKTSVICAATASLGPSLRMAMVHTRPCPAIAGFTSWVFSVMTKSAEVLTVTGALALGGVGSVGDEATALFVTVPVALGNTSTSTSTVRVSPGLMVP